MKRMILVLTLLLFTIYLYSQNGEKRIALVIGNSNYQGENTLKNPINDANIMATTLSQLGFTVIKKTDVNRQQMTSAITSFWEKLGQYNVTLFYFAGHGIAVNGVNYLLPIDAQMNDAISVELDAISVSSIIAKFDKYPNNTNILILDACRNNPFKDKRGSDRGFKAINPTKGTLIAFAAADGEFANDNPSGNNGLFTEKLVSQMKQPLMIEQVFKKTRSLVQIASNNQQNPMEWNMLNNDFYFLNPNNSMTIKEETSVPEITIEEETLTGSLKITSNMDGTFFLDGLSKGQFTNGKVYTLKNITVGEHNIKIGTWSKNVIIESNKTTEISCKNENIINKQPIDNETNSDFLYKNIQNGSLSNPTVGSGISYNDILVSTNYEVVNQSGNNQSVKVKCSGKITSIKLHFWIRNGSYRQGGFIVLNDDTGQTIYKFGNSTPNYKDTVTIPVENANSITIKPVSSRGDYFVIYADSKIYYSK